MFNYTFHWRPALNALPQMLQGALVTLQIAVLSMVIGIAVGVVLSVFSSSRNKLLYGIYATWVEVARNTPALFQIYMAYFASASSAYGSTASSPCSSASPSTMPATLPRPSAGD